MKIGVISDSHDNLGNLNKAIDILEKEKVKVLIHCGDFCAPFMIKELAKFKGDVHCVFGNIDDRYSSTKFAIEKGVNLYGDYAEIEIDAKKIAIVHSPFFAEALVLSNKYDVVFYGHDHEKREEKRGKTLLVNPGTLGGVFHTASFAIYDTEKNKIEFFEIK